MNEHFKGYNFGKIKNNVFRQKVICGCCGEIYRSYSKQEKKTGATYYYMVCRRRKLPAQYESKCFNRNIKRADLEYEIFTRIKNLETSGEIQFSKKVKPVDYEQKMKVIDDKINKLLDLYMDDRLPQATLNAKLEELNNQKEKLLTKSKETDYETTLMEELIKNGIPNLFEADVDTQTAIVDLFVDKIIIKDDELDVIWNG